MQRGTLGCRDLDAVLQEALNPTGPAIQRYGWTFRVDHYGAMPVLQYPADAWHYCAL